MLNILLYIYTNAQLPDALADYRKLMTAAGHAVNPQVTISDTVLPSKTT